MVAVVCTSSAVNFWTADLLVRKADGKAVGLDFAEVEVDDVSVCSSQPSRRKQTVD